MKFIKENELIKIWEESSSFRDFSNALNNKFNDKITELIDDDALLILTSITPDQLRELRKYFIFKIKKL